MSIKREVSCDQCWRAHKKCDLSDPCARCQDKQLCCSFSKSKTLHLPKASARAKLLEPIHKKRIFYIEKLRKRMRVPLARLPDTDEATADACIEEAIGASKAFLADTVSPINLYCLLTSLGSLGRDMPGSFVS